MALFNSLYTLLRKLASRLRRLGGTAGHLRTRPALMDRAGPGKNTPDDVAGHYDAATPTYLAATGDFIQSYRNRDTNGLMEYICRAAELGEDMRILDAGCGVGAPAIWLAQHFSRIRIDCVTISARQFEVAQRSVIENGLEDKITVHLGDYHKLQNLFERKLFDRALFLESLGHSNDIHAVFEGLRLTLKTRGMAYFKDMFKRASVIPDEQTKIDAAIAAINTNYSYNLLELAAFVSHSVQNELQIVRVCSPDIEPDFELAVEFEQKYGVETTTHYRDFYAFDWYEVLVRRY